MNKIRNLSFFIMVALLLSLLSACQNKKNSHGEKSNDDSLMIQKTEPVPAISLWANGLRAEPGKDGKWITTILFAEEVTAIGDSVYVEKEDRTYTKVRLTDGKDGWVYAYLFAFNAERAAITQNTTLFKRPDISTPAGKSLEFGEIIAIDEKQDDGWIHVFTKEKKKQGWIRSEQNLTYNDIDLTAAILLERAFSEKNRDQQKKSLEEIINNVEFQESVFFHMAEKALDTLEVNEFFDGLSEPL